MSEAFNEEKENNLQPSNSQIGNSKEKLADVLIWGATIFGMFAIVLALLMPFIIKNQFLGTPNYTKYSDLGAIGDYIGGTTVSMLTAASVFLLIATIIMQRREIKITQQGTLASIQQAEEARKEAVITNETMARQQFETTFFNMVSLHKKLGDEIRDKAEHVEYNAFINSIADFGYRYSQEKNAEFKDYAYTHIDDDMLKKIYTEFMSDYQREFKNYCNSFVIIIKFLRDSIFEKADKEAETRNNMVYREIFFSQLSSEELVFMYYYAKYNKINDWLLVELKTYNLFYPNLVESLLLFKETEIKEIEALQI